MPRQIQAQIHPAHLTHNLQRVRTASGDAKVWATIKADAYGHGITHAFEALRGADGFALLELHEAQTLRDLGWRGPILLIEGVFEPRDLEQCSRLKLWHVIHCSEQIDMLAAHKTHEPHRVFLKMNSGMNRLGFTPAAFRSAYTRLAALPQVDEISLMTHLSDADGQRLGADGQMHEGADYQVQTFLQTTRDLSGEVSLANSAALLRYPQLGADWVRAGIALYGSTPDAASHSAADWGLLPAMSLHSRIIAVQNLQAGDTVGYGSVFTANRAMRIGIVACGYADGYPRTTPTGTPILVDGLPSRTLGRVSMDMLAVDLSELPTAGYGSAVTLWGQADNGAIVSIDTIAAASGTLGYELMCGLNRRVPVQVV
ncbi:MAG: alanine racemase [Brachymonas sp.]|jgi:alanine racemase